jgi:hypothetical protein
MYAISPRICLLKILKTTANTEEILAGGMWEQGGDCMFSGGWNWGDVNTLEFDKNAINETDDILKEKNDE